MHTCPRRAKTGMDRDNSPLRHGGRDLDRWRKDRTCSYCGSMHPDDLMQAIRDGKVIGPTDKSYKFYVSEPLTEDERADRRQQQIGRYVGMGLTTEQATEQADADPVLGEGAHLGKFYTPHLSEQQGDEFDRLWRAHQITWGYPGAPYVPLLIPGQPKE